MTLRRSKSMSFVSRPSTGDRLGRLNGKEARLIFVDVSVIKSRPVLPQTVDLTFRIGQRV